MSALRILFSCVACAALPAHADLYRWIDPATGSPKFSNHAPQPGIKFEVIQFGQPSAPAPAPAPVAVPKPPARVADAKPAPPPPPEGLQR